MNTFCLLFTLATVFTNVLSGLNNDAFANQQIPDYYWREFHGHIPDDAIQAGVDDHTGQSSYIGGVYVFGDGIQVGALTEGKQELEVVTSDDNVLKMHNYLYILASKSPHLKWVSTTATQLHEVKGHLVEAGYEKGDNPGVLHVGRSKNYGTVVVGKVPGYDYLFNATLKYSKNSKVKNEHVYEVLAFQSRPLESN